MTKDFQLYNFMNFTTKLKLTKSPHRSRHKTKKVMTKTIKFLSMALIAAIILFSLSGCSKDDKKDASNASIVGTWNGVSFDVDGINIPLDVAGIFISVTFNQNGTWTVVSTGTELDDLGTGTYTVSGSIITLIEGGKSIIWKILSIEENSLIISFTDEDETDIKMTFTKSNSNDNNGNGNVKTPPYAASTKTWVVGNKIWSDAIHIPECKDAGFASVYNVPYCRSYMDGVNTYYYYNWTYVNQNADKLCPPPWRVPTWEDFTSIKDNNTLRDSWGYGGYAYGSGAIYYRDSQAHYWSSTDYSSSRAYYFTFSALGIYYRTNKYYGRQVRCVCEQ
jgi:hypothetical protein